MSPRVKADLAAAAWVLALVGGSVATIVGWH